MSTRGSGWCRARRGGLHRRLGLVIQQALLRWNQGQDLRQALITIAVSVIIADQMIAHFPRIVLPAPAVRRQRRQHDLARLDEPARRSAGLGRPVLARAARRCSRWASSSASPCGCGSTGRRRAWSSAPASTTEQMTSALGINIQATFAIAFFVGSALAGIGAAVGASQGRRVGPGRAVAAELARRRDRRRDGLADRRRRRLAARTGSCSRSPPPTCRRPAPTAARSTRSLHVRADRARARLQAAGALREGRA